MAARLYSWDSCSCKDRPMRLSIKSSPGISRSFWISRSMSISPSTPRLGGPREGSGVLVLELGSELESSRQSL